MVQTIIPTGIEQCFDKDEIIVSKTDLKGRLTYTNRIFMDIAGYEEKELLGEPHSMIRHPDMPRCVFKLLWDTLKAKKEIFAYVINMCKNVDHYWVLAHVTPSYDGAGHINGYHSNRHVPDRAVLNDTIIPLYKKLLDEERRHRVRKDGMNSASQMLTNILKEKGVESDELISAHFHDKN
jgi:PAS domain S-box-containing protein